MPYPSRPVLEVLPQFRDDVKHQSARDEIERLDRFVAEQYAAYTGDARLPRCRLQASLPQNERDAVAPPDDRLGRPNHRHAEQRPAYPSG